MKYLKTNSHFPNFLLYRHPLTALQLFVQCTISLLPPEYQHRNRIIDPSPNPEKDYCGTPHRLFPPLGRGSLCDVEILKPARLDMIHEPVHPQVLPAVGPCLTDRLQFDHVIDLRPHAILDEPREFVGGGPRGEPLGELYERREPALEYWVDWLRRRRTSGGRKSCHGTAALRVADDENWLARRAGGRSAGTGRRKGAKKSHYVRYS